MNATKFFKGCGNVEELKARFKELCKRFHPDLDGGCVETMKTVNAEYNDLLKNGWFTFDDHTGTVEDAEIYAEIIQKLSGLPEITIEVCGTWIWITGNTYPVKDQIKEAGCFFASKKKAWYWRPATERCYNRKPLELNQIRVAHGSKVIKSNQTKRIGA